MTTDEERREVARRLRENAEAHPDMSLILNLAFADDSLKPDGAMEWKVTPHDAAMRLADLIEPTCDPTERGIDSVYDWCRGRLEGADGAEDELYCSIMRAIEDYRHPGRASAHTVRAVDRDALLALADEMDRDGKIQRGRQKAGERWFIDGLDVREYARRIREALGVVA